MAVLEVIKVHETEEALRHLLKGVSIAARPRLKMLLLLHKGILSSKELAAKVGASTDSIANWKQRYKAKGLKALLKENRGGHKTGAISKEVHSLIEQRLGDHKGGFTSYTEAVTWINETFKLSMKYQAVNKYLKYHFDTKLKVGRKTHISKDPLAEVAFKKGTTC
jgi:transposase